MMNVVSIKDVIDGREEHLGIESIAGEDGLTREVARVHPHRLESYEHFLNALSKDTILIIPPSGITNLLNLPRRKLKELFYRFLFARVPCILLSENENPPEALVSFCESQRIPLFCSLHDDALLESRLIGIMREKLMKRMVVHGVLVNVYGQGVLIVGESGVGKTQCSLHLVELGHRWVADDVVGIEKREGDVLWGRSLSLNANLLEKKGEGIVRAEEIFSQESIMEETKVDLIVELRNSENESDTVFSWEETREMIGVKLPCMAIPSTSEPSPAYRIDESVHHYLTHLVHVKVPQ